MNTKEEIIKKIQEFDKKWFNEDQKLIAISIIESAPEKEAKQYFDFIAMKRRTGFAFDYSPEIAKGRIVKPIFKEKIGQGKVKQNILMIGENYDALKVLKTVYNKSIDIIYIDPPYNTDAMKEDGNQSSKDGTNTNKFVYKDKFGRGGWLNMMKQRLELSYDILSDEGIIFVSIDDYEHAYLKILMDDVFGLDNFIGNIANISTAGAKNDTKLLKKETEYVLVYRKTSAVTELNKIKTKKDWKIDDEGNKYILRSLDHSGKMPYVKGMDYKIEAPDGTPIVCGGDLDAWEDRQNGKHARSDWRWTISKDKYDTLSANGMIVFEQRKDNKGWKVYKKVLESEYKGAANTNHTNFLNAEGTDEINSIFGKKVFDTPKPTSLIKHLIKMVPNNENAVILDYFAGSGSTGEAVMSLNNEDGGNRKFILCTNDEKNIATDITIERLRAITEGKMRDGSIPSKWLKKNDIYSNEYIDVFELDNKTEIYPDIKDGDKIMNEVLFGLKGINDQYSPKELDLYYDLSALNPIEKDDDDIN